jgi:serralysin
MSESVVSMSTVLNHQAVNAANFRNHRQLNTGIKSALTQLQDWIQTSGDLQQLDLAFGGDWNRGLGLQLIQSWSQGEQLPEIEIVAPSVINGGNGAFDSTNRKIYISQNLLDRQAAQPGLLSAVILEELGHYFDTQVNSADSAGDEGAIFANLIQRKPITATGLAGFKQENDQTQIAIDGQIHNLELSTTYGNITVDGSLADWTAGERLDSAANGTATAGYEVYGKYNANTYLFALKSAQVIGAGTTIWLNTDQNKATGYQIFGSAIGGAEYNINFAPDGKAYLYSGADGQNYLAPLDYTLSADGLSAEIAVPTNLLGATTPAAIDLLADINNQVFLPGDYNNPNKLTVFQSGNPNPVFVPKNTYGNINLDGNLGDWTAIDRLDVFASQQADGYQVFGKNTTDGYVLAINSTTAAIGANTTIWLNTDGNKATGYQVFGSTVGAEYNINLAADGTPFLYSGNAGQTLIGQVDFKRSADGKRLEVAIPKASLATNGTDLQAYIDVNNAVFLPGDYASNSLTISNTPLPTRTNLNKRVGIVYSEASANKFFDKKAYGQLFTAAQNAAIAAGVPFDLLKESDLKDLGKIVNYDALIFPSFTNVNKADLSAIETTLTQAVTKYGIGIVTSGDFMTNDETGAGLAGDPYSRMKNLLGIQRVAGGGVLNAIITAKDVNNSILDPGYTTGEQLIRYDAGTAFAAYSAVGTGTILAEQAVNGATYNAIVATKTGGQNVHFANQSIFADSNIASQAIEGIVYKDQTRVSLDLTRNTSLFASRNDADLSKFSNVAPRVQNKFADVLTEWKSNYGFVGSHFINIGIDSTTAAGQSLIATSCPYCLALQIEGSPQGTDWTVMKPIYQRWLALGNEIGTHSYNHPMNVNDLTPEQLQFEFEGSKIEINRQLGINMTGAATPGNPENLAVDRQLDQYFSYVTGVGSAYKNAFGFIDPDAKAVSFVPNISFDFNLIDFRKLTVAQAEAEWAQEYNQLRSHAHKPIIEFAYHEYGVVEEEPVYTRSLYENFIARAFNDGTEFVTLDDAQNRLRAFQKSQFSVNQVGDTITAAVTPDGSTAGVGKFSLDIQSTKQIKNVSNYYAFDKDSVFLTKTGGNFTINLGAAADNVTHIVSLAQRAELLSVTGDGQNLDYSFNGEGKIAIDLNIPLGKGITTTGADSYKLVGNKLEMTFNQLGFHTAKVIVGNDLAPIVATPIANLKINENTATGSINLTTVFKDLDTTTDANQIIKSIQVAGNTSIATPTIMGNTLNLKYQPYAFGSSAITIRGTSGGKTVDNTFTITRTPSNLPAGASSNFINGTAANNTLTGGTLNNIIQGYGGNDTLKAGSKNDVLIGGIGNDILSGGTGNDLLIGVDPTSKTAGKGEIDRLAAAGRGDRFILGDVNQVYYNDGVSTNRGITDYARITSFSTTAGDVIQLKGKAADYSTGTSSVAGITGTAIYNNLFGQPELIGIVQNVSSLNLTSAAFSYV